MPLRQQRGTLTHFSEYIPGWITPKRVTKIVLTHAGRQRTLAPSHENLRGAREYDARTAGGRAPSGERGWRSWPCESCIASSRVVRHRTAGSAGKLRTEFVTLSRAPPCLPRCVTRTRRAAP